MTSPAGIRRRLEIPDDLETAPPGAKGRLDLLLAVKEAVHNVIKHSGAGVMRLRLDCGGDSLCFEVSDDGRGFDPSAAGRGRNGLESMRQRMTDAGGFLQLSSSPGGGSMLTFTLPWSAVK